MIVKYEACESCERRIKQMIETRGLESHKRVEQAQC